MDRSEQHSIRITAGEPIRMTLAEHLAGVKQDWERREARRREMPDPPPRQGITITPHTPQGTHTPPTMPPTVKAELRALIDRLSDDDAAEVLEHVRALVGKQS
jgi:hypothetical protein